jgi:hypothetical protein
LAESIASDTNERLVQRRMVFEGLKAVHGETHPYKLARKLAAFFPAKTDQDDFVLVQEKRRAWLGLSSPQQS